MKSNRVRFLNTAPIYKEIDAESYKQKENKKRIDKKRTELEKILFKRLLMFRAKGGKI